MKKETVFVRQSIREEAQGLANSFQNIGGFPVAAPVPDAQAGQPETRRRNAGHQARVISVGQGAVLDLARVLACLIPEKTERCALNFVEKLLVRSFVRSAAGLRVGAGGGRSATRQRCQRRAEQAHSANPHRLPARQNAFAAHFHVLKLLSNLERCSGATARVRAHPQSDSRRLNSELVLIVPEGESLGSKRECHFLRLTGSQG